MAFLFVFQYILSYVLSIKLFFLIHADCLGFPGDNVFKKKCFIIFVKTE